MRKKVQVLPRGKIIDCSNNNTAVVVLSADFIQSPVIMVNFSCPTAFEVLGAFSCEGFPLKQDFLQNF